MLVSGWIFPDGTYYPCESSNSFSHTDIFLAFFKGLERECSSLLIVLNELFEKYVENECNGFVKNAYTDFPIKFLGWIKVGTSLERNIVYAGYKFQEKYLEDYNFSWNTINCNYLSTSYIKISCNYSEIIEIGRTHFDFIKNYNSLYSNFRKMTLKNPNLSDQEILTAFDKSLIAIDKNIPTPYEYPIHEYLFKNANNVFSRGINFNIDEIYSDSKSLENQMWKIENFLYLDYMNFSQRFYVISSEILGNPEFFAVYFLINDFAHVKLYFKLLSSLILRSLGDIQINNYEDLYDRRIRRNNLCMAAFCNLNYIQWITDFLKDIGLYSEIIESRLKNFSDSDDFRVIKHDLANGVF